MLVSLTLVQILPVFHYGFPGVTELVSFYQEDIVWEQHWVFFFTRWEK